MPTFPKPISAKRLAANRANAARSTGPQSEPGKTRSAQNARKHGFTASNFAVIRVEELDEVARLRDDLIAVYQPINSQELFAIERIALAQQAILRAARIETGLLTASFNAAGDREGYFLTPIPNSTLQGIECTEGQIRNYALADGLHRLAGQSNGWSLFLRYQAQAERQYRRAVEEFERLKALRPDLPPELPQEIPNEPIGETQPEENKPAAPPETNPIPPAGTSLEPISVALPAITP